jgi:ribosomal-protein-alanine N-acetyltransferase
MEFTLREWKKSDIENVAQVANNKKVAKNLRNVFPNPYTKEDAEFYINMCLNADKSKDLFLAIDVDGKAVGSIGVFVKDDVYCKSAEMGYWLGEEYWGKGIMTEAVKRICKIAFEKFDIVRIFAEPCAHNIGSRRVLEKAGFKLEGILEKSVYKNNEFYDSCIYALIK